MEQREAVTGAERAGLGASQCHPSLHLPADSRGELVPNPLQALGCQVPSVWGCSPPCCASSRTLVTL